VGSSREGRSAVESSAEDAAIDDFSTEGSGMDLTSSTKVVVTNSSLAASTSAGTGAGQAIRSARFAVELVTVVEPSSSSSSSVSWKRTVRGA